jgi:nucleoside-diphosphate-sugar epimerase
VVQEESKLNVLVVGASGFIGKNLLLKTSKEWKIFGIYRNDKTFPEFLKTNKLSNVHAIKCDLENGLEVRNTMEKLENIDVCVYLAANTNVRQLCEDPTQDVATNVIPITNFLKHFRGRKLIFFSSGAVYMGLSGKVSASSKLDPTIPYAISKYASELYVKFYCNTLKTFKEYVILRFFGAFGPHEPKRKISTKLIELARNPHEDEFIVFGNGENYIDFMYIDDTIQGLLRVITSSKINETIDFCAGNPLTINQLVSRVGEIFEKEIRIKHVGSSPEYIRFHASPNRMSQLFGFNPTTPLQVGFRNFADWLDMQSKAQR